MHHALFLPPIGAQGTLGQREKEVGIVHKTNVCFARGAALRCRVSAALEVSITPRDASEHFRSPQPGIAHRRGLSHARREMRNAAAG